MREELTGRPAEIRRIGELTQAARSGRGGALVLRGQAGIGKSSLLEHSRRTASGFLIVQASGSEFETELPYAALHQLCVPMLADLGRLPEPQRAALEVAFGLGPGAPDLFRIGLATLGLLTLGARERPLLCLVDDAQWLDAASARVLAFLARRLAAEPIALLLAVRTPAAANSLDGVPELTVEGLSDADARTVLAAESHATLDDQVRDRIVAEARGNPLALLELPRAGGFAPPAGATVPSRIEGEYQARVTDDARTLLTIASADPTGDPALLWAAAARAGVDGPKASAAATATGLVEFSTRVRFCHPLARSAVYRAAGPDERRSAHRLLAGATDPLSDPDRRAWHRAQASAGPDDEVAAALERSAALAQARGGVVAAAAFLERAAALSLDPALRTARTLAAVAASLDAGNTDLAARLLTTVENAVLDETQRATVDLLRGRIAFVRHDDDGEGPRHMLRAAERLAEHDPERARECILDAFEMSLAVGRASGVLDQVLAAAKPAGPVPDILDALMLLADGDHRAAAPLLRQGLAGASLPLWTHRPALAVMLASELFDPDTHAAIAGWLLETGRESGAPLVLRLGLAQTASRAVLSGDLGRARASIAEEEAIADATGGPVVTYHRLQLAAMRGDRRSTLELVAASTAADTALGIGQLTANAHWSAAVLHNGLADYPAALAAARRATSQSDVFMAGLALPELIEAAVRCGEPDTATAALASLTERTEASGTASGLGLAAYARGLVTGVEEHYRQAVEHLAQSPMVPYRARAHLLYGEWLRRQGRRKDSRDQLRTAHELLSTHGIEAYARRAADELRATGEKARARTDRGYDQLTMQETYIAREVATGATSQEVATRLFLSPRTVDAHLRNIFRKLDITSRRQLRDLDL